MQLNWPTFAKRIIVNTKKWTCVSHKMCKFVREKHLPVNKDVILLVAEERTETTDGLSIPVHYVMQRKNSLNI